MPIEVARQIPFRYSSLQNILWWESTGRMSSNQIILLVQSGDGGAKIMKEAAFDLITLPHPKGMPVVFVQIAGELMELQCIEPKKRGSWFINQKVSSSSKVYVATKFDPRFLCLPYLERAGTKFCPLDQVVCTNDVVGCSRLPLTKSAQWKLDEITDVKDLGDDLILFRFNESKTLDWLSGKVKRTAVHFMNQRRQKMDMENVAFVSSFQSSIQANVNSKNSTTETQLSEPNSHDIKTAVQVISDYLSESMSEKLLKVFGLSASDLTDTKNLNSKRKTDWEADLEVEQETAAYVMAPRAPQTSSSKPATAAAVAPPKKKASDGKLGKPVQGAKTIASFFGKKG